MIVFVYQYFTGSIILYFTELVSKVFSNLLIDMSDFPARDAVKSLCKNKCFTHRLNVFFIRKLFPEYSFFWSQRF